MRSADPLADPVAFWLFLGFGCLLAVIAVGIVRFDSLMRGLGANANPLLRGRRYELDDGQNRIVRAMAGFCLLGIIAVLGWHFAVVWWK
jgi:hypothetical protein